jgi:hypothetical protein
LTRRAGRAARAHVVCAGSAAAERIVVAYVSASSASASAEKSAWETVPTGTFVAFGAVVVCSQLAATLCDEASTSGYRRIRMKAVPRAAIGLGDTCTCSGKGSRRLTQSAAAFRVRLTIGSRRTARARIVGAGSAAAEPIVVAHSSASKTIACVKGTRWNALSTAALAICRA